MSQQCLFIGRAFAWMRRAALAVVLAFLPGMGNAGEPPKHVLILSVDGMHFFDLAAYAAAHPTSAFAALLQHGYNYSEAATAVPADSFPGGLAIFTGGSPAATGVYFDTTYDRSLWPPNTTSGPPGTLVIWDDSVDLDSTQLDGGGGLDPAKLPRDPSRGGALVYPHDYLRVNTVFEVVKAAGGRTAWCDKHLADEIVNGPSGTGVDDLFTPEIAANNRFGASITKSVDATKEYDDTKVEAVLNEIAGLDHAGVAATGIPALFGMNFQAVSVAQRNGKNRQIDGTKYPSGSPSIVGGYTDATGSPSFILEDALAHTDASIQRILDALQVHGLLDQTCVVLTAKHGNSPVDRTQLSYFPASGSGSIPGLIDPSVVHVLQATQDDCSLLWLEDPSTTPDAVAALLASQASSHIVEIWSGDALNRHFPAPANDNRRPDIIVLPQTGTFYDAGLPGNPTSKIAEHGGFSADDTHVPLVVYNPKFEARTVSEPVQVAEIAPTILRWLGVDPQNLQAVVLEKTRTLPGFAPMTVSRVDLSSGAAHVEIQGQDGQDFVLQGSFDLMEWNDLAAATVPSAGVITVTDSEAGRLRERYYRAIPSP